MEFFIEWCTIRLSIPWIIYCRIESTYTKLIEFYLVYTNSPWSNQPSKQRQFGCLDKCRDHQHSNIIHKCGSHHPNWQCAYILGESTTIYSNSNKDPNEEQTQISHYLLQRKKRYYLWIPLCLFLLKQAIHRILKMMVKARQLAISNPLQEAQLLLQLFHTRS